MRLFGAIQLDEGIKAALTAVQSTLRASRVGGNYTKIENLHLTLAFIGEYGDPDRLLGVTVPEARFDRFNIDLTGITPEAVADAPVFPELWRELEPMMSSGLSFRTAND